MMFDMYGRVDAWRNVEQEKRGLIIKTVFEHGIEPANIIFGKRNVSFYQHEINRILKPRSPAEKLLLEIIQKKNVNVTTKFGHGNPMIFNEERSKSNLA